MKVPLDNIPKRKITSIENVSGIQSYLRRIGATVTGMRVAKIQRKSGKYITDVCTIRFNKSGTISCGKKEYAPTKEEAEYIEEELKQCSWPNIQPLHSIETNKLPAELKDHWVNNPRNVFTFRDEQNKIIMLQVRIDTVTGKHYQPWTYWDDDEWRKIPPDDGLPIWGAERLKNASIVMLHEGAKAARHCHEMITLKTPEMLEKLTNHPWSESLQNVTHVGWIGGATNPHLTDWSIFKRNNIKKVYIVADNDTWGVAAVPTISKGLDVPAFVVEFSQKWPQSFDLADDFPEKLFQQIPDTEFLSYIGPSFDACVSCATWATDEHVRPDGKGVYHTLRDCFRNQWYYIQEIERYVCSEQPTLIWKPSAVDATLAAFSHMAKTTTLINKTFNGSHMRICYRPGDEEIITDYMDQPAVNVHVGSKIKSKEGSVLPWFEYLEYMFPNQEERYEVMRWCATLIGKPSVKINYGLLLVSRMQGIGKTTLGQSILSPLVGRHNTSLPSAKTLVEENFNGWLANMRLVVCDEIYYGHSWKAYHVLKSSITDKEIYINEKMIPQYKSENWAHFVACSNADVPLKMDDDDRRWFIPTVAEVKWPKEKFKKLRQWLTVIGLQNIKHWAETFGDYIDEADSAPMTEAKRILIRDSRSDPATRLIEFVENINLVQKPLAFGMKDVYSFVRPASPTRTFDTDRSLRAELIKAKGLLFGKQLKIKGQSQEVLMNKTMFGGLTGDDNVDLKYIRGFLTTASNFMQSQEIDEM